MKRSDLSFLLGGFIIGIALCWFCEPLISTSKHRQQSRSPARTEKLKIMNNGVEVHTLALDRYNALIGYLEDEDQTNALDLFRQYRCAYGADMSSSDLGDALLILQNLRRGANPQNYREGTGN